MRLVPKRLRWLGFGAAVGWLFDAEHGKQRRTRLAERSSGVLRGLSTSVGRISPFAAEKLRDLGDAVDPKRDDPNRTAAGSGGAIATS